MDINYEINKLFPFSRSQNAHNYQNIHVIKLKATL